MTVFQYQSEEMYATFKSIEKVSTNLNFSSDTLCVCICFLTFDFWAKARPQTMHWNGFSPVWDLRCCCKSKFLRNALSQYWHFSFLLEASSEGVPLATVVHAGAIGTLPCRGRGLSRSDTAGITSKADLNFLSKQKRKNFQMNLQQYRQKVRHLLSSQKHSINNVNSK